MMSIRSIKLTPTVLQNVPLVSVLEEHGADLTRGAASQALSADLAKRLRSHFWRESAIVRRTDYTLEQVRALSAIAFGDLFAEVGWTIEIQKYREQGRVFERGNDKFEEIVVKLEDRHAAKRGLPEDWMSFFAVIIDQETPNRIASARLVVREDPDVDSWTLARSPKSRGSLRTGYVLSLDDKVSHIENFFNLRPLEEFIPELVDPNARVGIFSQMPASENQLRGWMESGTWLAPRDAKFDVVEIMSNDPRAHKELPADWQDRVRFKRSFKAAKPNAVMDELFVNRATTPKAPPRWYSVQMRELTNATGTHPMMYNSAQQTAFLKNYFFRTKMPVRGIKEQTRLWEAAWYGEEYVLGAVIAAETINDLQRRGFWYTRDNANDPSHMRKYEKIDRALSRLGIEPAKRAGWQNAFAFAGRYDPKTGELRKPAAQSYKMCVLYRGEWRLCQYRALKTKTSIETYELQPAEQLNQDNQAGFVRCWLESTLF